MAKVFIKVFIISISLLMILLQFPSESFANPFSRLMKGAAKTFRKAPSKSSTRFFPKIPSKSPTATKMFVTPAAWDWQIKSLESIRKSDNKSLEKFGTASVFILGTGTGYEVIVPERGQIEPYKSSKDEHFSKMINKAYDHYQSESSNKKDNSTVSIEIKKLAKKYKNSVFVDTDSIEKLTVLPQKRVLVLDDGKIIGKAYKKSFEITYVDMQKLLIPPEFANKSTRKLLYRKIRSKEIRLLSYACNQENQKGSKKLPSRYLLNNGKGYSFREQNLSMNSIYKDIERSNIELLVIICELRSNNLIIGGEKTNLDLSQLLKSCDKCGTSMLLFNESNLKSNIDLSEKTLVGNFRIAAKQNCLIKLLLGMFGKDVETRLEKESTISKKSHSELSKLMTNQTISFYPGRRSNEDKCLYFDVQKKFNY